MKIDLELPLLTRREREFLRCIALKLHDDAQRRWRDLPHRVTSRAWMKCSGSGCLMAVASRPPLTNAAAAVVPKRERRIPGRETENRLA